MHTGHIFVLGGDSHESVLQEQKIFDVVLNVNGIQLLHQRRAGVPVHFFAAVQNIGTGEGRDRYAEPDHR